jgi:hypothetical protein
MYYAHADDLHAWRKNERQHHGVMPRNSAPLCEIVPEFQEGKLLHIHVH